MTAERTHQSISEIKGLALLGLRGEAAVKMVIMLRQNGLNLCEVLWLSQEMQSACIKAGKAGS